MSTLMEIREKGRERVKQLILRGRERWKKRESIRLEKSVCVNSSMNRSFKRIEGCKNSRIGQRKRSRRRERERRET